MLTEFSTIGVAPEASYATWPAGPANKTLLNVTDIQPKRNRGKATPAVYTGDRRTYGEQVLDQDGDLVLPANLQYENFLALHEVLMASSRSAAITESQSDISCSSGVLTSAALADFSSFLVGDRVYLSGAGISPNVAGIYGPVLAKTTLTLTLPSGQISDFSSGSAVNVATRRLRDGTTSMSLAWEAHKTQLSVYPFVLGLGYDVASIAWNWNREGANFATEQATLKGKEWTPETATASGGSTAAPATGYMTAIDPSLGGVGKFWIADGTAALGAASSLIVSQWTITWQNVLQMVKGLGSSGPSAIDKGNLGGSNMTLRIRLDDAASALLPLIQANTLMQAGISARDPEGNWMDWFVPAAKPSGDTTWGATGTPLYLPLTLTTCDPAKESDSTYYNAGAGIGFQHQISYIAAS